MIKKLLLGAALAVISCSPADTPLAAENGGPNARNIKILTEWFEGRFDNSEEMWFVNDSRSGVEKQDYHVRVHVMHRRLDLPQFGDHIFYVEEYNSNDTTKVHRQRFVRFTKQDETGEIRMEQGFFKDKDKYLGGYFDTSKFDKLKKKDIYFMSDLDPTGKCDVYWKRQGGQFIGKMPEKKCLHVAEGERQRYYVHDMYLSEDEYWRVDTSFHVDDDSRRVGVPREEPAQMRRAKTFECSGNFRPKGGAFLTNNGVLPIEPFLLHNQGGTHQVTRSTDGKKFNLLLREKLYPFYEEQPDFLYLSAKREDAERSFTYTISDVDSRRFGLFNDEEGLQVFCSLPGYKFRESLEILETMK